MSEPHHEPSERDRLRAAVAAAARAVRELEDADDAEDADLAWEEPGDSIPLGDLVAEVAA